MAFSNSLTQKGQNAAALWRHPARHRGSFPVPQRPLMEKQAQHRLETDQRLGPAARAVGGTRPKHGGEPESCGFSREVTKKRGIKGFEGGEWEAANQSGWIHSSTDQEPAASSPDGNQRPHLHVRVVVKRPFSQHFVSGQRTDNKSGALNPPINTVEGVGGRGGSQQPSSDINQDQYCTTMGELGQNSHS